MHGIIDYAFVATGFLMPRLLEWDETSQRASDAVSGTALAASLMTDYPPGLVRVLPMKAHLALDVVQTMALVGAAARANSRAGRAGLLGMAAFGTVVTALTRPQ